MTKQSIVRLFLGSIAAVVAALVLGIGAVIAGYAGGAFTMRGPDVVGIEASAFAWTILGLAVVSLLVLIGGAIAGLVAWIGALLNSAQLPDKTWFVVLLVLGIWNLGFVAMIAYVMGAPDATRLSVQRPAPNLDLSPRA
jgi:hypothetical protein